MRMARLRQREHDKMDNLCAMLEAAQLQVTTLQASIREQHELQATLALAIEETFRIEQELNARPAGAASLQHPLMPHPIMKQAEEVIQHFVDGQLLVRHT